MPDLHYCLKVAVEEKKIDQANADRVGRLYDAYLRQAEASGSAGLANAEAKRQVAALLKAEADHERRKAKRALATIRRLASDLDSFRTPAGEKDVGEAALAVLENNDAKMMSVVGRERSILSEAHARMEKLLYQFRRGNWGGDLTRHNKAQLPNVVRELFGEESGDASANEMAAAFTDTAEWLRQRFNAAGGAIGKLENWGLPQRHDPVALYDFGKQKWIDAIKPMLAPERMRHPLTGQVVLPEELDAILDGIWGEIATDGLNTLEPSRLAFGKGALANQHAEHRFLVFKNADTWMEYQKAFGGGGDPFATMMAHVSRMAKDIAAMEVLGPNPDSTLNWLKQVVMSEAAKRRAGEPHRFAGTLRARAWDKMTGKDTATDKALNRASGIVYQLDNLWGDIRGALNTPVSEGKASWASGARSLITSAVLGSASLSSLGDMATSAATLAFATGAKGSPIDTFKNLVYALTPKGAREAVAAGLIQDSAINVFHQQARYVANLQGPGWASYLADRVLTLSLLSPWTRGAKHGFGLGFMHEVSNQLGKAWSDIHPFFRETFEQFGLSEKDWGSFNLAKVHKTESGLTLLRGRELAVHNKAAAERYMNMILSLTQRAVPDGTHRSRIAWLAGTRAGTGPGELLRSIAQFKIFATVFAMLHGREVMRLAMGGKPMRAAAYGTTVLVGTTLMGAVSMQLNSIAQGRDPQSMNSKAFWGAAILRGGGLGIYGDFLFSDVNRYGGGLAGTLSGPLIEKGGEFLSLTIGNAIELGQGKDTNLGREAIKFAKGMIPGASIWWTRLAMERLFLDQMQFLADPEANAAFKRRQQNFARNYGQEFWWQPGQVTPRRGPNISNAITSSPG